MKLIVHAGLTLAGLSLLATASQAKPEYARKENKACGYCHVKSDGGGPRNARGVYYAMHNHTFAGYDEATVIGGGAPVGGGGAKKGGPPAFKSSWKSEVLAGTSRIAIGDVTGDKSARLIGLGSSGKLTIYKVGAGGAEQDGTVDLGAKVTKFEVGNFAKGKPAVIVVPKAIFYREGDKYVKKDAADLDDFTGRVRFTDGNASNIFFFGGSSVDTYFVDTSGANPLKAGQEMVWPGPEKYYAEIVLHAPPDMLGQLGIPENGRQAGVLGLLDARGDGKLYAVFPMMDTDNKFKMVVADSSGVGPGGSGEIKVLWTSPTLAGKVLDFALGSDPKGSKATGILVLQATGEGGKGRTVEFFALD
jgi:hypothetical protein